MTGWVEWEPRLFDFGGLAAGSLVWDVGGYEGEWARGMVGKYGCVAECFEPVPDYAGGIAGPGVVVRPYGLLDRGCRLPVRVAGDGSGVFGGVAASKAVVEVEGEFRDVVEELAGRDVAVMKLNVEGAEYDVLDRLLAAGEMGRIGSLLVQFHGFVPGAERRRQVIIGGLAGTHVRRWCEPWVWERWDLCRCAA